VVDARRASRLRDVRFKAVTNDVFEAEGRHYITIWMEAGSVSGEAVLAAPYEASEIAWFSWDNLPESLFPPFRRLLDGRCYPRTA